MFKNLHGSVSAGERAMSFGAQAVAEGRDFMVASLDCTIYTAPIGAAGRAWCAELSEVHLQRMPE